MAKFARGKRPIFDYQLPWITADGPSFGEKGNPHDGGPKFVRFFALRHIIQKYF